MKTIDILPKREECDQSYWPEPFVFRVFYPLCIFAVLKLHSLVKVRTLEIACFCIPSILHRVNLKADQCLLEFVKRLGEYSVLDV